MDQGTPGGRPGARLPRNAQAPASTGGVPRGRRRPAASPADAAPRADAHGGKLRLFVAEKPSVARELARVLGARERRPGAFVGGQNVVAWCVGHMGELAAPEAYDPAWRSWRRETLPMLPDAFRVVVAPRNATHWNVLRDWLRHRDVGELVNACDAGREGELIFRYVLELANVRRPVRRLWLNAMTDAAIARALRELRPQADYDGLADAARCRAEADWLVGLNATRAMTVVRREVPGGGELCSLGRVQTPTLAMVYARDTQIDGFVAEDFFEVAASLQAPAPQPASDAKATAAASGGSGGRGAGDDASTAGRRAAGPAHADANLAKFTAFAQPAPTERFVPRGDTPAAAASDVAQAAPAQSASPTRGAATPPAAGRAPPTAATPTRYARREQADAVAARLRGRLARVAAVEPRTERTPPPLLYDLTALQREANARFGLSAHDTLAAAQTLYEQDKALTYPRTDSNYLPEAMRPGLPALLRRLDVGPYSAFVSPLLAAAAAGAPLQTGRMVNDAEVSDHHAIVPTGARPAALTPGTARAQVYDLVVRRFIAGFLPAARHARTTVRLDCDGVTLCSRGRVTLERGWQAVERRDGAVGVEAGPQLPDLAVGAHCRVHTANVRPGRTQPPPPLTEATLLGAMERAGRTLRAPELRLAMKDAGLGTPATRAATIEVLKKRSYVVARGRDVRCTEAGRALIEALPVQALKDAELTGAWEAKLGEVARGARGRAAFMAEVRREVAGMVRAIVVGSGPSGARQAAAELRRPGVVAAAPPPPAGAKEQACPVCGTAVSRDRFPLRCARGRSCSFVVFDTVAGRKLKPDEVQCLIDGQPTPSLRGFRSRAGKPFAARLRLDAAGRVALFWDTASDDAPASATPPPAGR